MHEGQIHPTPPPPERPELPESAAPRWPAWFGIVAFFVALIATNVVVGVLGAAVGEEGREEPVFTTVSVLLLGIITAGTAVLFASFVSRPRPEHFGLRPTRFWPAVGWAALGIGAFYLLSIVYVVLVQPDVEQTVVEDLGAEESTFALVAAGFMVICVAPVAEEFFYRGFFYRALRSRFTVIVAAVLDGLLFGFIHWNFTDVDLLLIVPPLATLGFVFCLVYERTGSIYPVIGLHALNNSLAYGEATGEAWVSLTLGPLVLVACALVPRAQRTAMA